MVFTGNVARESVDGRSSYGFVVVPIVHEDSAEVANQIDDKEHSTFLRAHSQVAAMSVARHRMALCGSYKGIVHRAGATEDAAGGVRSESKNQLRMFARPVSRYLR